VKTKSLKKLMDNQLDESNLVSIIVPAYRAATVIGETINSVIAQTYSNWEMLIADDCSPDNTTEVVLNAAARDPRIKLIKCLINGGPAAARNAALARAKGRWIAFLDSDDVWLPTKLADTINFALAKSSVLTFTGFRRMSFDGQVIGRYISVPSRLSFHALLGNTAIATSTVLVDRSRIKSLVMRPVYYDDFVCWLEILKQGHLAHGLDSDLMRYRVVSNSVSRNKRRSATEVWKIYREVEKIGRVMSAWYFANYAIRAFIKYRSL